MALKKVPGHINGRVVWSVGMLLAGFGWCAKEHEPKPNPAEEGVESRESSDNETCFNTSDLDCT